MSDILHTIEQKWSNRGLAFYPGSNMYSLMTAIATEYDRQIEQAGKVSAATKINTAEDDVLDKLGFAVGLPRETGESDERYRVRIKLRYRLNSIEGTMDEIAQFTAAMVGTPASEMDFTTDFNAESATLTINAQSDVWDGSVLTRQEIENFAGQVVSGGHRVTLEDSGTFILTSDSLLTQQGNIVEYGLTSDAISTGGTLASDITTN